MADSPNVEDDLALKARGYERLKSQKRLCRRASRWRKETNMVDIAPSNSMVRTSAAHHSDQHNMERTLNSSEPLMRLHVADGTRDAQQALDDCRLLTPLQSLRKDPFDCLPIQSRPYIPRVIDFFFDLFASPYVYRPELIDAKRAGDFQRQYFQFAMQHEVLFQSVMTLSLACLQAMSETQALVPTKEVLFHHTNALVVLRQKLSCPRGYVDDSTLLSILTLLGVAHFYCNTGTFGVHLAGLHKVLERRGGARNSPWYLFIQSRTLTYNSLWTRTASESQRIRFLEGLAYPEHPYNHDLCKRITELPLGFQELCLRGRLSLQIIDILSRANAWTLEMNASTDGTIGPSHSNVLEPTLCTKLLHSHALRPLEQCLCVTMMAYHLDAFPKKPLQPLTRESLHRPTLPSPDYPSGDVDVDKCLLWVAVILEMTKDSSISTLFDSYRRQWNLLDRIFDHTPSTRSWSWVQRCLEVLLWSSWFAERAETAWKHALILWQRKQGVVLSDGVPILKSL